MDNKLKYLAAGAISLLMMSCGQTSEDKANDLLTQARESYEKGECSAALDRLAEIDSLYSDAVKTRREAMHFKPQVIERQTLAELSETDSLLALNQWVGDSLTKNFRKVNNAIENYYVTKNAPAEINSHPGLYGRMSPDGVLYFMAVSPGVAADQISVNSSTSSQLPHDGERCAKVGANQVLTLLEGELENVLVAIGNSTGSTAELTFLNRGSQTGKLTLKSSDVEALGQVCQMAQNLRQFRLLQIKKERLERTLTVARNQIARTTPDTVTAK